MIVLDTNVLSEPLRPHPNRDVLRWLRRVDDPAVTAITVAELLTGARALPSGARRDALVALIDRTLTGRQILAFDEDAARIYARMHETRRAAGHPLSVEDGMIAAIAASRRATLATRNIRDFEGLDVPLIDPWAVA